MSSATAIAPHRGAASPASRLLWLDTFRGLVIIQVVVAHVIGGLAQSGFVPEPSRERLWDAYELMYTFRMPALFIASGLFASRSVRKGTRVFIGDKARTLAYPYVVWSLICWGLHMLGSGFTNSAPDPFTPVRMLYDPMAGAWFLYVLFAVMAVFGLWAGAGGGRLGFLAMALAVHWIVPLFDSAPSLVYQVSRFLPYFGFGLLLGAHAAGLADRLSPARLAVLVPAAFLTMKGTVALGTDPISGLDLVTGLCGTTGLFGLAMLLDRLPIVGVIRALGRFSMELYVAAGIGSVASRALLVSGLGVTALPVHLLANTVAGFFFPLVLAAFCHAIGFRYLFTWPKPEDASPPRPRPQAPRELFARRPSSIAGNAA